MMSVGFRVLQATAAAEHGVLWRGCRNGPGVTVSAQRPAAAAAHGIKLSSYFASDRSGMRMGTALVAAMDYPLLRNLMNLALKTVFRLNQPYSHPICISIF